MKVNWDLKSPECLQRKHDWKNTTSFWLRNTWTTCSHCSTSAPDACRWYIDSLRSLWISFGVLFEPGVMQNEWPVLLSPLGQDYLHISILNNTFDFWRLVSSCQFDIFDVLSQMALRSRCFPTRNRWIDYLKDLGGITSFSDAPWRICHGNNNLADVPKQRLDSTPQLWRVKSCGFFSGELAKHGQICREPKWSQGEDVGVGRVPCWSCSLSTFTMPCITV